MRDCVHWPLMTGYWLLMTDYCAGVWLRVLAATMSAQLAMPMGQEPAADR